MTNSKAKIPTKPKGFNAITAAISVANVSDALAFYGEVLGAETVDALTVPGTETVVHATAKIAGTTIVLSLDENALPHSGTGHVTLYHYLENVEEAFEQAINNGAVVVSPVALTWWGEKSATVIDPFGVKWSFAERTETLNKEERQERFEELYATPVVDDVVDVDPASIAIEAPVMGAEDAAIEATN
ncbi:VOC family protein [Aliiroseovarius marinus]|uniref:VOC family protein n=1 Tax=Aliiroseovarius marinus TaxID=2500159 RepID=UPI002493E80B|nr:VOC family protein [Aliiroseovarius marinus]